MMFPKPVRRPKERKRLRQVSPKKAARVAAGEQAAGMKRGRIEYQPPRRLAGSGSDPGKQAWTRAQDCVGLAFFPGHRCVGDNTFSHERDHTGTGLKAPDARGCCMCWGLHDEWGRATTEGKGPWQGMTPDDRKRWMARRCDEFEALWQAMTDDERTWWRDVGAQRERAERDAEV
jgi:hypothetical protein